VEQGKKDSTSGKVLEGFEQSLPENIIEHVAPGNVEGEGEEKDIELFCRDCNVAFIFTIGEQQYFKERQFDSEPT